MTRSRERLHDAYERSPRYQSRRMGWGFTVIGALAIYAATWLFR